MAVVVVVVLVLVVVVVLLLSLVMAVAAIDAIGVLALFARLISSAMLLSNVTSMFSRSIEAFSLLACSLACLMCFRFMQIFFCSV